MNGDAGHDKSRPADADGEYRGRSSPTDPSAPLGAASAQLDIAANRRTRKWSAGELAARALWETIQPLFRLSPRIMWGWRCWLLRLFGAHIGRHVHIHPTVHVAIPWNLHTGDFASIGDRVQVYSLGEVFIGAGATISQGAHLCAGTHDHRRADLPLLKPPIHIGAGAWVCADAFVGPGVTVGAHAIVAARAVAVADVAAWTIVAGNPAQFVKPRPPLI